MPIEVPETLQDDQDFKSGNHSRSDSRYILYGVANLITYATFYSMLPEFQNTLTTSFGSHATLAYGISATGGHILGLFLTRSLAIDETIVTSYVLLCFPSLLVGFIPWLSQPLNLYVGVSAIALLGLVGSFQQIFVASRASAQSADALLNFYIGQSVSGLLPYPCFMIGSTKLLGLLNISTEFRSVVLFSAAVCTTLCCIVAISHGLSSRRYNKLLFDPQNLAHRARTLWTVLSVVRTTALSVFGLTLVSFAVYPREIVRWKPGPESRFSSEISYQSCFMYIAMGSDVLGMATSVWVFNLPFSSVPVLTALRVIFIPLFWIAGWNYFDSDYIRGTLIAAMSYSGALVFGSALNGVTNQVRETEQETLGALMSSCFSLGIAGGGILGHSVGMVLENS
jgi:hypothetical protein